MAFGGLINAGNAGNADWGNNSKGPVTGGSQWGNPFKRSSSQGEVNPNEFSLQGQNERRQSLLQQADFAAGRGAPQIAGSQFRGDQNSLVNILQAQAAGNGPSAAGDQLKQALGRNVSTQQALLATGGPGGARQASQQAGMLGGSLAGQAATARVQEQLGAQGLLSQTLQGARGQDQQRNIQQSDMELRSRGMNDQQIARLRQMELDNARLGLQGSMERASDATTRRGQDLGLPSTGEQVVSAAGPLLGLL